VLAWKKLRAKPGVGEKLAEERRERGKDLKSWRKVRRGEKRERKGSKSWRKSSRGKREKSWRKVS